MNDFDHHNQQRGHLTGTLGFLIAQVAALAAGLIVQAVSARNLSAADYGRFAVAHTLVLVAAHLLCGVLPRAYAQHLSVSPGALPSVWRSLLRLHLPVCLMAGFVMWACRNPLARWIADSEMGPLVFVVALLVAIQCGILEPCWQILNGLRRHRLQACLLTAHSVTRAIAVSTAVLSGGGGWWAVAGMLIASTISTAVVVSYCAMRLRPAAAVPGSAGLDSVGLEIVDLGPRTVWTWTKFSALVDVAYHLGAMFSLWYVKAQVVDARLVAIYAACFMVGQTNLPICRVVSRGYFSYVAAEYGAGNRAGALRLVRSASRLLMIGLFLELAAACVLGGTFVEWFSGMAPPNDWLPIALLMGSAGVGVCCVLSDLLAAARQLRLRFLAAALYAPAAIGAVVLATSRYGIAGAATAYCAGGFVALAATLWLCRRTFGAGNLLPTFARCGLASAGAAFLSGVLLPHRGIATVIAGGVVVALLYFAFLTALGEFTATQRRVVTRFLSGRRRPLLPAGDRIPEEPHVGVS